MHVEEGMATCAAQGHKPLLRPGLHDMGRWAGCSTPNRGSARGARGTSVQGRWAASRMGATTGGGDGDGTVRHAGSAEPALHQEATCSDTGGAGRAVGVNRHSSEELWRAVVGVVGAAAAAAAGWRPARGGQLRAVLPQQQQLLLQQRLRHAVHAVGRRRRAMAAQPWQWCCRRRVQGPAVQRRRHQRAAAAAAAAGRVLRAAVLPAQHAELLLGDALPRRGRPATTGDGGGGWWGARGCGLQCKRGVASGACSLVRCMGTHEGSS